MNIYIYIFIPEVVDDDDVVKMADVSLHGSWSFQFEFNNSKHILLTVSIGGKACGAYLGYGKVMATWTLIVIVVKPLKSSESNEPRQANLCLRAFRHDKF